MNPNYISFGIGVTLGVALGAGGLILLQRRREDNTPPQDDGTGISGIKRMNFPVPSKWSYGAREDLFRRELEFLESLSAKSTIKIDFMSCKLSKEELRDKIKGILWGQAIGDAVGLATENLSRETAEAIYGELVKRQGFISFADFLADGHRSKWDASDWTDDTDQMLCILQSICENKGEVNIKDIGKRIQDWSRRGFPELGDITGRGIGMTVGAVLAHASFLQDPIKASYEVWVSGGKRYASNGAPMRTSVVGAIDFDSLETVADNAATIAKVTHFDPRTVATAVAVSVAVALVLQGFTDSNEIALQATKVAMDYLNDDEVEVSTEDPTPKTNQASNEREMGKFQSETARSEFIRHLQAKSLKELELDDRFAQGYTYKLLGSVFWALRQGKGFMQDIMPLVMAAGDADTNCAAAGGLLGAKYGFDALPVVWRDYLLEKDYLTLHCNRLLVALDLITPAEALAELERSLAQS